MTTKIIKILQDNKNVKEETFGIALDSCVKGEDLEYLMMLWKEKEKTQKKKLMKVTEYFDTEKKYFVLNDELIFNEDEFRNVVAEVKFGEKALQDKKYDLFFTLLGTEPERAFYHIIMDDLEEEKIFKKIIPKR